MAVEESAPRHTFITFDDGSSLELQPCGDIVARKPNTDARVVTPQGYTIIKSSAPNILHPNSTVSWPGRDNGKTYTNERGFGLDKGHLNTVPTLRKLTEDGKLITRRDDGTITVEEPSYKWIQFDDGTEYMHQEGKILI